MTKIPFFSFDSSDSAEGSLYYLYSFTCAETWNEGGTNTGKCESVICPRRMDKDLEVVSRALFWASFLGSIRLITITPSGCFFLWAFRLHHHKFKRGVL